MKKSALTGTREWATRTSNILVGCTHACHYCYARHNTVDRFKKVSADEWERPTLCEKIRIPGKVNGVIMFPTTHDILPDFLDECTAHLHRLLEPGNRVLIVSKPHLMCIRRLCTALEDYKGQILFRFTIGSDDGSLLNYWEPGAPSYVERRLALQHAYDAGYRTSVSAEPMLDPAHICRLVEALVPVVSQTIWIGPMNKVRQRVKVKDERDEAMVSAILDASTPERLRNIYEILKGHPLVSWKNEIRKLVGLPESCEASTEWKERTR